MKNGSEEKKTKRKEERREYGQKKKKRPLIEMNRSLSPIDGEDGSGYFAYFTRPIMRLSVTTGNEKCAPARLCVCVCVWPAAHLQECFIACFLLRDEHNYERARAYARVMRGVQLY